jgi:predicted DNA-binding transcriptional regulator AlpA
MQHDRLQCRDRTNYSQNKILVHRSSIYRKLDKEALPEKVPIKAISLWECSQLLPMSIMTLKQAKKKPLKLEQLLVPFL